ncbi:hypothetical protein ANTPLA_LOCUS7840 [Anthophora plagiata]
MTLRQYPNVDSIISTQKFKIFKPKYNNSQSCLKSELLSPQYTPITGLRTDIKSAWASLTLPTVFPSPSRTTNS